MKIAALLLFLLIATVGIVAAFVMAEHASNPAEVIGGALLLIFAGGAAAIPMLTLTRWRR